MECNSKPTIHLQSDTTNTTSDTPSPPFSQRLCPALCSSLVISCLGCCDSLCGHTPSSPLQVIQNAAAHLVFNLPRPSCVIHLIQSLHWRLVLNTKDPAAGKHGGEGIHTCTAPGHCPGSTRTSLLGSAATTVHSARCVDSFPSLAAIPEVSFFLSWPTSPTLQILLKCLCSFHNYCNSTLLVGSCEFHCCTPIKLLRTRASVKLMKCKCHSFCPPLFFISSALVHGRTNVLRQRMQVHLNIKISVTWARSIRVGKFHASCPECAIHVCPRGACTVLSLSH